MIVCPYCDAENIEGADACDACGHSLSELHLPTPATTFELSLLTDRVRSLPPQRPVIVPSEMTLAAVLKLLVENRVGSVMIVKDSRLVGIFSERDALVKVGADAADAGERPISEFMTPDPTSLKADDKVAFAVQRMDVGGFRHVPIVDEKGVPSGVVSVRDILRYLTERMAEAASL